MYGAYHLGAVQYGMQYAGVGQVVWHGLTRGNHRNLAQDPEIRALYFSYFEVYGVYTSFLCPFMDLCLALFSLVEI